MQTAAEITHNHTEQCDWLGEENRTEPRVTEQPDSGACLFLSILPYEEAVPALMWMFVLLTLFSLLVNGFTLFGLGRSDDLSLQPHVAFFKNLILSDLLQTVTFAPPVIYSLVQRRTMSFSAWCCVQYFLGTVSIFSSLVTITWMALERYFFVCHAIRYLVILTEVRRRLILSLIWVFSICIGIVNVVLLFTGRGPQAERVTNGLLCEPDTVEQHMGFPRAVAIFRKSIGSFTLLLCLLVYAFSYLRMYQDACNAVAPFNEVNTAARKTVLFYCGMLILQLLPVLVKVTSDALWEVEGTAAMMAPSSPSQGARKAVVLHMSLLVMLFVPPCINPLVYGTRNAEMRRVLLSLFRCWPEIRSAHVREMEVLRVGDVVPQNHRAHVEPNGQCEVLQ
ncbi:olfactory receptor 2A12 [Plectropomus leopardus]|uniref:olfactory receptor 2A12 n=1 Tax=Plectropomus leopardus TaxID=160734 RepID=UPI001C4B3F3F|nr:olfactory receptor 2A12 [Plectropomus leopardus]